MLPGPLRGDYTIKEVTGAIASFGDCTPRETLYEEWPPILARKALQAAWPVFSPRPRGILI